MQDVSFFKKKRKILAIILLDLLIIAAIIIYFGVIRTPLPIKISGTYMQNPNEINQFKLRDNLGNLINKETLKGHWTLVYFGFTSCAMICPTTMQILKETFEILQKDLPEKKWPKVIFISVDPLNDSQKKLNDYVHSFHPDFIGARGELDDIKALQKQFHLPVSSQPSAHGLDILLINPDVKVQAYFSSPISPLQLANDIKVLMRANK